MLTFRRPFSGLFGHDCECGDLFQGEPTNGNRVDFAPAVDIEEKADHFLISADLPGVNEKEIEIKVQDGVLLLSGKREVSKEQESKGGYLKERSFGSFYRSFTLGDGVDAEKIEATYKSGVLTVKLPKSQVTKPRQIQVKVN